MTAPAIRLVRAAALGVRGPSRCPIPRTAAAAASTSPATAPYRCLCVARQARHAYSTAAAAAAPASTTKAATAATRRSPPSRPATVKIAGRSFPTDEWYNVPANVVAAAGRQLHLQTDHPVAIARQLIEAQFPADTYRAYQAGRAGAGQHPAGLLHPVVTTFQNFDSLGFPADHPGRQRSDTYYVNATTLLRTHTSAHELETFAADASAGYLLSADVYRRDEVDRTHYPVFHQMEGARVWRRPHPGADLAAAVWADVARLPAHGVEVLDPTPPFDDATNPRQAAHHSADEVAALGAHLKRTLELMVVAVFRRAQQAAAATATATASAAGGGDAPAPAHEPLRMRWVEAYFPFTSPSWELEVYYQGDWLEVLGCGVSQQAILQAAGVPDQIGWAFGIGLDRIAMLLFQIPDIRLFWSTDERFLGQFRGVAADLDRLRPFVPFSKHPACYKDVSFWEAPAGDVHSNDIMEVIRSVAGDKAEDVRLLDAFVHPKTGRRSHCYRITYRSLERTLSNAETNRLNIAVSKALEQQLGVEIRW